MGVVKNLMVRVGADVRGIVGGMKTASTATSHAKNSIQKDSGSIKNAVNGAFSGVGSSVRAYSETLQNTKKAHEVAKQNVVRLGDKVEGLKGVYTTVRTATEGLDLTKPLTEQMVEAEKALTEIEHKRKKLERSLANITTARQASSPRTKAMREELEQLTRKSEMAEARLANLDRVAEAVGSENMGHASAAGLEKLRQEIQRTENELNTAKLMADETGKRIKEMGSVRGFAVGQAVRAIGTGAAQAARGGVQMLGKGLKAVGSAAAKAVAGGVKRLTQGLKSLASSAVRGIASLPGKLLRIGKSASSGAGGVGKLVRQIRNIGVVSLGMRVAGGMFGRLRSIVSSYISANEELNAATSLLTKQMGQALEPAIRLVTAAMQQLMPMVTKVAGSVNAVLKSIIGDVGDVQYAFRQLGTYGFDQITKADEEETGGSQIEQEQSALVQKLTGWIGQLKAAFVSGDWAGLGKLLGDSINGAFAPLGNLNLGKKLGIFLENATTALHSLLSTVDFDGIGRQLSRMLGDVFGKVDPDKAGQILGKMLTALPRMLLGFVQQTNWDTLGQKLRQVLRGVLGEVTQLADSINWPQLMEKLRKRLQKLDWKKITGNVISLLKRAFRGLQLSGVTEELGKAFSGVLEGLGKALSDTDWGKLGSDMSRRLNGVVAGIDWGKLGRSISSLMSGALEFVFGAIEGFDWQNLGDSIADFVNGIDWADLLKTVASGVSETLSGALDLLTGFTQQLNWSKLGSDLWDGLVGALEEIKWDELISKVFELLGSSIAGGASLAVSFFSKAGETLSEGWKDAWSYFDGFVDEAGGDVGQGILDGILAAWADIDNWIKDNLLQPFIEGFEKVFDVKELVTGALGIDLDKMKADTGITDEHVQAAGDKLKEERAPQQSENGSTIGKLLDQVLKSSVVSAIANALSLPDIPFMANGGVVSEATTAVVGERGKEAVVPLERNTGWMDKVADKVSTKVTGGGGNQPVILQIFLGKRKLTEYVIEDINQITRSTGVCPINV